MSGVQVGVGGAVLVPRVDPLLIEALQLVLETVLVHRGEVQGRELEGDDEVLVADAHLLHPRRRSLEGERLVELEEVRQYHSRSVAIHPDSGDRHYVEALDAAEVQIAVAHPGRRRLVELLLQAVGRVVVPEQFALGVEAGEGRVRADPELAVLGLEDGVDPLRVQALALTEATEPHPALASILGRPAVDAGGARRDPQVAVAVTRHPPGGVAAQARRVRGVVAVAGEGASGAVHAVDSRLGRADPEVPLRVFVDRHHPVAAEALRVVRVVAEALEDLPFPVEAIQSAAEGADP